MSQSYDEITREASEEFDRLVVANNNEDIIALQLAIQFPIYSTLMGTILETTMLLKAQYIQLYAAGKELFNAEVASQQLGPQTLIDPYNRGND